MTEFDGKTVELGYRWEDARQAERAIRNFYRDAYQRKLAGERAKLRRKVRKAKNLHKEGLARKSRLTDPKRIAKRISRMAARPTARLAGARQLPSAGDRGTLAHTPTFSVIVPVYNNGSVLPTALKSVFDQTFQDYEVVVWDDGSVDLETGTFLNELHGPNISVFRAKNQGVVGARNSATEESRGRFIIYLDPDDALEPTYLEKAYLAFARYPRADVVVPATRVIDLGTGEEVIWYPGPFTERHLSYANHAPIASAFRRRVWETVGGMSPHMADGYEDWAFWRAVSGHGFRGISLNEALFRYTYSADSGRDSEARKKHSELERTVKTMFPVVRAEEMLESDATVSVGEILAEQIFHVPSDGRQPVVIFVPWMLLGGGAENFLLSAIENLLDRFQFTVIATETPPDGFDTCSEAFLALTPYIYDAAALVGPDDRSALVNSILRRLHAPTLLVVGSPWAYENLPRIKRWGRGHCRVVDVHFNNVGHIGEMLQVEAEIDQIITAHDHLRNLLVDYFEVAPPVTSVFIAPPERTGDSETPVVSIPTGNRLRVGWLGRNSPEKRLDLVWRLALLAPDVDFVVAGGNMGSVLGEKGRLANIDLLGWVGSPTSVVASCDLLLNTSDIEGISLSAMEALELGVPVLTRDVGGMSELVQDGVNGFVYSADDLPALAMRISDRALVDEVKANVSKQRLLPKFQTAQMVDALAQLLDLPALERD